jgi:hypothetical protein
MFLSTTASKSRHRRHRCTSNAHLLHLLVLTHVQVFVAFLVSALLTWCTTVGYLLLQPRQKPKRHNPIDELWTKHVCLRVQARVPNADRWSECLYRVTFALSDQQLVTGIAILVAGFKLLGEGTITAYHFSIVRDLAFFSSNAHLLSLLALWSAFGSKQRQDKPGGRRHVPFVTKWRFLCMFAVWCLLLAATWTTAYREWDNWASCPARCIPRGGKNLGGTPLGWAIATTYFLILQYGAYALVLGEKTLGRATYLRGRIRGFNDVAERRLEAHVVLLNIYKVGRFVAVGWRFLFFSEFFDVLETLAWFAANCYWVVGDRRAAEQVFGDSADGIKQRAKENEWGFGQIVPLLLLMLPVMAFVETWRGECYCVALANLAYPGFRDEQRKGRGTTGA